MFVFSYEFIQEDESKQDEETTTLIDLDEISGRVDNKAKSKVIN